MQIDDNTQQEMTLDPINGVVQYHVINPDYDAIVVDDYNTVSENMNAQIT